MEKKTIRVAHIVGKMVGGGVESFIMNYYRNIDREKIQFDFIIDSDSTVVPKQEIEDLGGKIIEVPPYQHIFKYIKSLTKILKENKYKIVHSHLNSLSVFPLFCAYMADVPVRIAHSHSTTNQKEWKRNFIKNILKQFSKIFSTHYFACSEYAGRWLFGNKTYNSGKVKIINNAIDTEKFKNDEKIRKVIRKELNIEDKFVIGHVGRFVQQKNHDFLIDIFKEIYKEKENAILLLIGDGPLENKMKNKAKELQLEDKILFLGIKENVNEYMQAMDVFVLPSLYEGLGIVAIEAQYSGLPCVVSTEVPKDVEITEKIAFCKLTEDIESWKKNIINSNTKRDDYLIIKDNKFDITLNKDLELLYIHYVKKSVHKGEKNV